MGSLSEGNSSIVGKVRTSEPRSPPQERKERCHAKFLEGHLNELGLLSDPNKSYLIKLTELD